MVDLSTAKNVYLKNMSGDLIIPYTGERTFSRNIGELVYSNLPLSDSELHLLDGSLINGSGSYTDFVTHIASIYANQSYRHLFVTEAVWQQTVTTYGVCGKFVYTAASGNSPATVRLPKVTGIVEGTVSLSALGELAPETLPNIKGLTSYLSDTASETSSVSGAFYNASNSTYARLRVSDQVIGNIQLGFDASRSNSVYQDNASVHPQTIKMFAYMVVATSTKTRVSVDIDNIATDLNGKADADLTNINATGIVNIVDKLMPNYNAALSFSSGYTTTRRYIGYVRGTGSVKINNHEVFFSSVETGGQFIVPNGSTLTTTGTFSVLELYPIGA